MATNSAPTDAEFISELAALCGEWNRTEEWIKRCETINGNVLLPSINELRYAGRRLVDACEARRDGVHKTAHIYIKDAEQNLMKARHDVVDAVVAYISDSANDCRNRLGAGNLQKHFSEYGALFSLLKQVLEKTAQSRMDRTRRDSVYETMAEKDLPRLLEMHGAMIESLPAIEQNIAKENRQNLYYAMFGIGGIVFGIASVVAGILF